MGFWSTHLAARHGTNAQNVNIILLSQQDSKATGTLLFPEKKIKWYVFGLATGWTVRGSNPGGGEIFRTCPDQPWGLPSLLYNG